MDPGAKELIIRRKSYTTSSGNRDSFEVLSCLVLPSFITWVNGLSRGKCPHRMVS